METLVFDSRYLNPLTDFGFHKLFGTESCKELLIDFLNEIIKKEGLIIDIQYLPPEQWGYFESERKAIFDIFCRNEKGEYFIVEMQRARQKHFCDRSIFYASLPIRKQAPRGVWDFELKAVYLVAVLDFVIFEDDEENKNNIIEHVNLVREQTKTLYSNKLNFIFVELPKFKKSVEELKTNVDKWLFALKNLSQLKERPVAFQGKVFETLFQLADIKQLTRKDMREYNKSILKYHDVRDAVDYAEERGFEKGHKEGIEKGKVFIMQKCLQKNMSLEDIIDLTGFSKEQIIQYKTNKVQL
jgi:predicted transposase/invertase (TIGR01784 family)